VKTKTLGSHLIKELLILMTLKETKDKKLRERRKHAIADSATEEDKALVELLL
jgi:spore coat polysaccharide biosynthesis protein SpsF (cytidylyltransferase family)